MKKRASIIIVTIVIFLILVVAGGTFFILKTDKINPEKENNKNLPNNDEDYTIENLIDNKDDSPSEQTSAETTGDSSGSSGSQSESTCSTKQISYSMENLNKISICNLNQSDICLDKTISCSIDIHNLDIETNGNFKMELIFLEKGKNKEIDGFDIKTSQLFVESLEYETFTDSTNIQSTGIDGLANKEISCFYNTIEVPVKEVC